MMSLVVEDEGKRARRSTRYRCHTFDSNDHPTTDWCCYCYCYLISGDFQTRFELPSSDEDADSDAGPKKRKVGRPPGPGKTKRTKECPGCGAKHSLSMKECNFCDYQFTSKSMLVTTQSAAEESQHIRDRFPFEPERVSLPYLVFRCNPGLTMIYDILKLINIVSYRRKMDRCSSKP